MKGPFIPNVFHTAHQEGLGVHVTDAWLVLYSSQWAARTAFFFMGDQSQRCSLETSLSLCMRQDVLQWAEDLVERSGKAALTIATSQSISAIKGQGQGHVFSHRIFSEPFLWNVYAGLWWEAYVFSSALLSTRKFSKMFVKLSTMFNPLKTGFLSSKIAYIKVPKSTDYTLNQIILLNITWHLFFLLKDSFLSCILCHPSLSVFLLFFQQFLLSLFLGQFLKDGLPLVLALLFTLTQLPLVIVSILLSNPDLSNDL